MQRSGEFYQIVFKSGLCVLQNLFRFFFVALTGDVDDIGKGIVRIRLVFQEIVTKAVDEFLEKLERDFYLKEFLILLRIF